MPDEPENEGRRPAELRELLSQIQPDLRRFIVSLTGSLADADDLAQETSLTIWEKREEFRPGSNFKAWAFSIARFKVMSLRRDRYRDRLSLFGSEMGAELEARLVEMTAEVPAKQEILRDCLAQLSADEMELLEARYSGEGSLVQLAEERGMKADAAHKAISRLRGRLKSEIEKQLKRG